MQTSVKPQLLTTFMSKNKSNFLYITIHGYKKVDVYVNAHGTCFEVFKSQYQKFGVGMIRVDFGPISETDYIDILLNTIIER